MSMNNDNNFTNTYGTTSVPEGSAPMRPGSEFKTAGQSMQPPILSPSTINRSPVLQPAFEQVVPALFGAMAYKYFRGNLGIALPPLVTISVLFCLVPALLSATSFMILPCGAIAISIAWWQFTREQKNKSQ